MLNFSIFCTFLKLVFVILKNKRNITNLGCFYFSNPKIFRVIGILKNIKKKIVKINKFQKINKFELFEFINFPKSMLIFSIFVLLKLFFEIKKNKLNIKHYKSLICFCFCIPRIFRVIGI